MPTYRITNEHENYLHFITLTVIEWVDIFTKPEYFKIIIDSLNFCQENKGLKLYEFVIMTNHVHLIASAEEKFKLSQIISDIKKHTTREIFKTLNKDNRKYILKLLKNSYSKKLGYTNQVWQRENFPEVLISEKVLNQKINYIHQNPVKKEYVINAEDWLYSSARNRILNNDDIIVLDDYT